MNFKEKISIYYTSLTVTEKRICTKILDNPTIIINNSIIEAGEICNTSKSAMLRFAKKLGYKGYSEFKYAIQDYYQKQSAMISTSDQSKTALFQLANSYQQTIETLATMDYDESLKQLAKMIDQYPYVKAIGIGNTAFCASQLIYSLYSHTKFFEAVTDDIQFDYLKNCINTEYLLIIFSVSGSSNRYTELLKRAKTSGAKIVLISMNPDTVIHSYADINFIIPSTISPLKNNTVLKQLDNRITLYFFAEIISNYYGLYLEEKDSI